jgi:starch phosphorylase
LKKRDGYESIRTGHAIAEARIDNLHYFQAKLSLEATRNDWYMALAYTVRDRMLDRYIETVEAVTGPESSAKVVAYLSAEFLTGSHLGNSLINLVMWQAADEAVPRFRQNLFELLEQEEESGLGNGGLGRLLRGGNLSGAAALYRLSRTAAPCGRRSVFTNEVMRCRTSKYI